MVAHFVTTSWRRNAHFTNSQVTRIINFSTETVKLISMLNKYCQSWPFCFC